MERPDDRMDLSPLRPSPDRIDRVVVGAMATIRTRGQATLAEATARELARWCLPALVAAGLAWMALRPRPPQAPAAPVAQSVARLGPAVGVPVQVARWASTGTPPPADVMAHELGIVMRAQ